MRRETNRIGLFQTNVGEINIKKANNTPLAWRDALFHYEGGEQASGGGCRRQGSAGPAWMEERHMDFRRSTANSQQVKCCVVCDVDPEPTSAV